MTLRLGSACTAIIISSLFTASAHARLTYCCADEKGKQVCSDVLPQACYGKAYREINERGITTKRVDAPLTAEQRAEKELEEKKAKEDAQKKLQQDRKNRALLATYSTEQDIEDMRRRAVGDMQKTIQDFERKLNDAGKTQKKLATDAEFHKKTGLPRELKNDIRENEDDIKTYQVAIQEKQKDIAAVKAKYDEDLQRFRDLKGGKPTPTLVLPPVAAQPSAADKRPR